MLDSKNAQIYQDIEKILISGEDIQKGVSELGAHIKADYEGKEVIFVGILKGAMLFFSDLIRNIDLPLEVDFMAISSYGNSTKSSGVV